MKSQDAFVRLADMVQIVDAINTAFETVHSQGARIELLLEKLLELLDRRCLIKCVKLERLPPKPIPVQSDCYHLLDAEREIDGDLLERYLSQEAIDVGFAFSRRLIFKVSERPRFPHSVIGSRALGEQWSESELFQTFVQPMGYVDMLSAGWAATPNFGVGLSILRGKEDPPFSERDQVLVELTLRAVAPHLNIGLFDDNHRLYNRPMTPRQREVLSFILSGYSEAEIAIKLERSPNTIHRFVQQLYEIYDVHSKGELMALFVDQTVLDLISTN